MILAKSAIASEPNANNIPERINYIQDVFNKGTDSAKHWWYGWVGFYSSATAVSLALALTTNNPTLQITGGVSAGESLIGLSGMLIFPFRAKNAAEELKNMPDTTPEEKKKKLETAELLLKQSSDEELAGRSWVQHMLGVLVNAAGAVVVWPIYNNRIKQAGGTAWQQALGLFIVGTAVSELQIWTEPTTAIHGESNYLSTYHTHVESNLFFLPLDKGLSFEIIVRF
ncbi:MAG: hypothetical protein ACP5MB_11420 [bacterium]